MGSLKEKGGLWVWGSNAHGAIGVVDQDEAGEVLAEQIDHSKSPRFVRELANVPIIQVDCGNQFCAILTYAGEVWTWGNGQHGKLGHLDQLDQPLPKKIVSLENVSKIACGQEHMMCISGGNVYSWGCGFYGRLGHASVKPEPEPREIQALSGCPMVNIFCGATSFAVDTRGVLWAWGSAAYGQIGNGERMAELTIPAQTNLLGVTQLACSERHVIAIADKVLYAWGSNNEGQLGTGDFKDVMKPVKVVIPSLPGTPAEDIMPLHVACGRAYSAVVTKKGEVFTFGSGDEGELGHNTLRARSCTPVKVTWEPNPLPGYVPPVITQVSCGEGFMVALTTERRVYAWGTDKSGQLGVGGKFAEEQVVQKKIVTNKQVTEVVDDLALAIGGLTPKKAKVKRVRNPTSPSKRKTAAPQAAEKQAASASAPALQTHSLKPLLIPWFYKVHQIKCGHSHTMALVEYDHRFLQAVRDGDFASVKELLDGNKSGSKFATEDHHYAHGFHAIHWSVLRNHPKVLSHMLAHVSHSLEHASQGQTPVVLAALHGHLDVLKILLEAKANPNARDHSGNTALHHAANAKRIDICSHLILNGAIAEIENNNNKKPLEFFALQEVFELKKQIKAYDVAIYCADEDLEFSKDLKAQIENFHIVCSLNEDGSDPKTFIKGARALIFVLSNYSAATQDSLTILRLAKSSKKLVYPIWRQKATMSSALESLIYRNQLVDFTDSAKFVDSTAQLVGGLRNIFEDKEAVEEDAMVDDSVEVDEAFSKMVEHPNMKILPADLLHFKKQYLYLCHDGGDSRKAALLAASLCEHGFICCYYNEDPHVVGELITNCWTFLLVLSSRSSASSLVRDQIALAENRQKLILPVQVQKSRITLDPAMTYTLARVARFPFFIGDNDVTACVAKLVEAIRLAKKVSEKSEKLKGLREEVVVVSEKLDKSNTYMKEFKAKVLQHKKVPVPASTSTGR
eukprot:Phypoly_transcript_01611.p1 GENE.Phypoly_transcript_01611~~Phypoly_transcript_01611.p1  ORF type:complete len:965 (+),score=173.57 Phypoly_transcript_01611:120-3014(+)